jgi:alkanesulfonate monooxygenase SsuD/methylene tetrahydromethanopterin reductase-like flavin-dependent oxidoreductase (luciferase family)
MTEPQLGGTYDELLAAARWTEANGLASFARSDHYYSSRTPTPAATDAFTSLGGLARETTDLRMCVLVSPITFRHPAVIAKAAATLDQMSGGRLDLGVGTGWMELEHRAFGLDFPARAERFDRLVETLQYLETAFAPGPGTFSGRYYRFEADALPKPTGTRIVVGGSGATRTPTLAGVHAHEYNSFIDTPDNARPRIDVMRRSAEAAGRDPDAVMVSMMGSVFAAPDHTSYRDLLELEASRRQLEPKEFEAKMLAEGTPIGTPDRVGETLAALAAVGVTRIYLQWFDLTDLTGLDQLWAALQAV